MKKADLIKKYERLMYKHGEYDIWEDDIEPKLKDMTAEQIRKDYEADKAFYEARKQSGGHW